MRTRAVLTSTFASIGVLFIGWQAGANVLIAADSTAVTTTSASGTGSSTGTTSGTATTNSTTTSTAQSGAADGTYVGSVVSTRFGNVQVQVTLVGGAITEVTPLMLTDDDRKSVQISNRAAPILREEVIASQSANVSNVGGATYTTRAYLSSLQSALDLAGF